MRRGEHFGTGEADSTFERATRRVRWVVILTTAATFPPDEASAPYIYALVAVSVFYNLMRYVPFLLKQRLFASPVTMLVMDNVMVGVFLVIIGSLATPYSAFLIFMIVSAAYRFGWRGFLGVIGGQAITLLAVASQSLYPPVMLDNTRLVLVSGAALLMIGIFILDLTQVDRDERQALENLSRENRSERERLLTLVNSLNDAIFMVDGKGRLILGNGAAGELVAGEGDFRGSALVKTLPLYPRAKPDAKPVNILEAGSNPQHRRDLTLRYDDGTTVDLDISVTPVRSEDKKHTTYIIVCRDITNERSLDEQREEFIAVASHELRTPLAIVEAALSTALLSPEAKSAHLRPLLEQAHRNTVFLAGLIHDLSTLSQAQNDNLPIALKPVAAKALLHQIAIDFEAQAKEKDLPLQVKVAKDTPAVLSTEHHIHEIIQNFVSNALKYTAKGRITLKAEPSQNGGVLFSVSDTGVGISVTDQRNLFKKFYRAEDYRTRETGGTGLGLYLCLELAQRLNAKVWCESVINVGSTFFLEVPPFSRLEEDHGEVMQAQVANLVDQL
jgi:PAS domain S-box-containing protein